MVALVGSDPLPVEAGPDPWRSRDPGVTATDDVSGDVGDRAVVVGASRVDLMQLGSVTILYKVADDAGNTATIPRTLHIQGRCHAACVVSGVWLVVSVSYASD